MTARTISPDELRELARTQTTIDIPTTAAAIGKGEAQAYREIKDGVFPLPVFRSGRRLRVPSAAVLRLLELDEPS
jgi:predicted DNA-binding transcriptional regulator AlpA